MAVKPWPIKKLGEVLKLCDAGIWGVEDPCGMPLLRSSNMQNGQLILDDLKYVNVSEGKKEYYRLLEGDILVTKSSGSADHVGKSLYISAEMNGIYGFSNFTQRLRANKDLIDPKWVYLKISDPSTRSFLLDASQTTTGLRNLKISALKELEIPLPPIEIQKKIVKKIEELFALIDKVKSVRELSNEKVNIFISFAIRIICEETKKKYDLKSLGDIVSLVRGPFGGSLKKDIFVKSGYAVYEQGNIIKNRLNDFRYYISATKYTEMKRFTVHPGDILMSCSGTIGKLAVVQEKFTAGIINQALLKISPGNALKVDYLKYVLQDYISQFITRHTKGSAIKNIVAVALLKKIEIPLPPLAEQKKIVAQLDALTQKVRELQTLQTETSENLVALKQSILHQAFQGELLYR
jgi:type I restriction enzyme, S subunit